MLRTACYGQNAALQPYDLPVTRGRGAERVGVRDETFHWKRVELDRLLTMKMIANRAHDHVHVMNLYRSGAIDCTCIDRVPAHLRMPLKDVLDRCDCEYGNSPH